MANFSSIKARALVVGPNEFLSRTKKFRKAYYDFLNFLVEIKKSFEKRTGALAYL